MRRLPILLLGALSLAPLADAAAIETNFSRDVAAAIDRGLDYLDNQGAFRNGSAAGDGAGLTAIAVLEKRQSADPQAPPIGYFNASPRDQGRIEAVMTYIINRSVGVGFYAYRDGADLMALSVYLRSGGPQQAGAMQSINAIFDRIANNQSGAGYWCYSSPGCPDSSTTQLVMAGLAAARGVFNDPAYSDPGRLATLEALVARTRQGYAGNGTAGGLGGGERGHGYNAGSEASYQQTASGLWGQIIGGADLNDGSVQSYLRWLYHRYNYVTTSAANGGWSLSYHYYMWSSAKAYTFIEDSAVMPAAGNLTTSDLGTLPPGNGPGFGARQTHRDPMTDPRVPQLGNEGAGYYADRLEPARWYYDYAYTLMQNQDASGYFNPGPGNSTWDTFASQSYALLVLERSVGGGCVDADRDNICDAEDVCAGLANPEQADADGDGFGDVCDNCVNVANGDQVDSDGDGFGDACPPCTPFAEICDGADNDCDALVDEAVDGGPCRTGGLGVCGDGRAVCQDGELVCSADAVPSLELCDGLDNDCDGLVDNNTIGDGQVCGTGLPGECALGVAFCVDGAEPACQPDVSAGVELCDGLDNDCNGRIDDGLRNACDQCGGEPAETCNGLDDDCDGVPDDEAPCLGDQLCRGGRCQDPCQNNECDNGFQCVDGFCATACEATPCPRGQTCQADGRCVDLCAGVQCAEGQACNLGRCGANDCTGLGCPDGQRCTDNGCLPDACAGVLCDPEQFCRAGRCISSCAYITCPFGEACFEGACRPEPCGGVTCPDGQVCQQGACGADPCEGVSCPEGRVCVQGLCTVDPCAGIECPGGEVCVVDVAGDVQCAGPWTVEGLAPPPADAGVSADDAGGLGLDIGLAIDAAAAPDAGNAFVQPADQVAGCACRVGDGQAPRWLLLPALVGFAVTRRRRRR